MRILTQFMGSIGKRGEKFKFTEAFVLDNLEKHFFRTSEMTWQHIHLFHWESDYVVKTKAGLWYEIEVKVSVEDFRRDFKDKTEKHLILSGEIAKPLKPNRFYYAVPEPIRETVLAELPPYAGLITIPRCGRVSSIASAPMLTRTKWKDEELDLTRKFYFLARSYKDRYNGFADEKAALKAELELVKAEFEAATGQKWKSYFKDCQ